MNLTPLPIRDPNSQPAVFSSRAEHWPCGEKVFFPGRMLCAASFKSQQAFCIRRKNPFPHNHGRSTISFRKLKVARAFWLEPMFFLPIVTLLHNKFGTDRASLELSLPPKSLEPHDHATELRDSNAENYWQARKFSDCGLVKWLSELSVRGYGSLRRRGNCALRTRSVRCAVWAAPTCQMSFSIAANRQCDDHELWQSMESTISICVR